MRLDSRLTPRAAEMRRIADRNYRSTKRIEDEVTEDLALWIPQINREIADVASEGITSMCVTFPVPNLGADSMLYSLTKERMLSAHYRSRGYQTNPSYNADDRSWTILIEW